jgi:hypothetical protein
MIFAGASLITFVLCALSAKAEYINPVDASSVTQCHTIQLSFKGTPPFTVSAWPGCDDDATTDHPIAQYQTNLTTVLWKVNVAGGKSVMFGIEGAHGDYDWSDDYVVHKSDDSSCVGKGPSFSSPGSPATTPATSPLGNAGGLPTTTPNNATHTTTTTTPTTTGAKKVGGLGGAMPNLSPRMELAGLVVVGSSFATLFI